MVTTEQTPDRLVVGHSTRTSSDTQGAEIGALWQRVGAEGLLRAPRAIAVYHGYDRPTETAFTCTLTIGYEVGEDDETPAGLDRVRVAAATCVPFATDGSVDGIRQAWTDVWQRWPSGGPRTFKQDLEVWEIGAGGAPTAATLYIGVDPADVTA